jgi:1-acyl-sn-glycerol-3-phosphate acyltransferase
MIEARSGGRKFDDESVSRASLQPDVIKPILMSYPILSGKSRSVLHVMVAVRAAAIALMLTFFLLVGAPIQWLILRLDPRLSHVLPRRFNRLLLRLLKVRVAVHGLKPAEIPRLIVANHVSWTDVPALGTLYSICFLAKQEVSTWPIIASFARLQRTVFVDRSKRKSVLNANAALAQRMLAGACVALFPEGTTYDGTSLGPFRSAHFAVAQDLFSLSSGEASLRVYPVAIRYSSPHAAWCGDALLLPHVIGLLRGAPVTCDLIFCAPLDFDAAADRKAIADECRRRIAAALAAEAGGGAQA